MPFYNEVIFQLHEGLLIDKTPFGLANNPNFNNAARGGAINTIIRGSEHNDGNGYVTIFRNNEHKFKNLPKKNIKQPMPEPTITVTELVQFMENSNFRDNDGNIFYPEVYRYTPFVKIAIEDKDRLIPEGLSNRMKTVNIGTEENPIYDEQVKTWDEWFNPPNVHTSHPIVEGYIYYISYIPYKGVLEDVVGSELMIINDSTYAQLVDDIPVIEGEGVV